MQRIPQKLLPLVAIAVLGLGALIAARQILVPKTFGEYGHYRAAAMDDIRKQDIAYAGISVCAECHDDIFAMKQQSLHRGLTCEVCHGPAAKHANAPDEFTPDAPRGRGYCPLCHGYNISRPSGFPQIIAERHNPGKPCMSCHNPHNPTLPNTPEDCSACHRGIYNVKLVSHHAALPCTQCHVVPEGHKNSPHLVQALKPTSRETCGTCHAKNASSDSFVPRIDMDKHGERYLCWDCHYPHYPEANE